MKNNKAITLIALIITIIVLLILAGVTINMVLGENGLINKSKTSVAKYENAQEKENTALKDYETEIDNASRDTVTISKEEYEILKNINSYSIEEQEIGNWVNGQKLYKKTINCGSLPSNTYKDIPINVNNIDRIVNIYGTAKNISGKETYPLPYLTDSKDWEIRIDINNNNNSIRIKTFQSSGYFGTVDTECYVTLEYTKTTDSATNT